MNTQDPKYQPKSQCTSSLEQNYFLPYAVRYPVFPQLCFHSNRNEPNYAATLSSIIIIFIICHLPRLIKTVYEIAFTKMVKNSGGSCDGFVNPSKCLVYFNNFILVINASSGFFVYCFIGSFGKKFIEVLSQNCRRGKSASNTVYILEQ